MGSSLPPPRLAPRPRWTALALVLAAHALLLLLAPQALHRPTPEQAEPARGLLVRLLPGPRPASTPPPAARWQRPAPAPARPAPKAQAKESTPATQLPSTEMQDKQADDTTAAQALPNSITPATPPASGSLLDSEGTRRALRQAGREPLLSERAATASEDPGRKTAQQRLSQSMNQAANGDCLKGEFAGGGMGLLSLPFWALAEARGKCRR